MVAVHVPVALVGKGFEPNILAGVFGALHHHVQNRQTVVMAKLVEQQADNGSRHTPER